MRQDASKLQRRYGLRAVVVAVLIGMLALMLSQGAGVRALDPADFEPTANITLSDYDSGVNADLTIGFGVPFGDYNYSNFISFIPVEFFPGEDVPLGAKVGGLDATATLGLLNGPCNVPLPPHFDLYRASTDTSDTITWGEQFENDPLPRSHAGMHDGIYHFPDLITRILPGETPAERMYGYANVGGSDVTINFVVLEAGSLGYPAAWGRPSVTILNDIGDPGGIPEPSPITSFCTPLDTEIVTFGLSQNNLETGEDEAGYEWRRNPAYGGTYTFHWFAEGMIDADGDGIANYNDTCPYDVNKGDFRLIHTAGGGDGATECDGDEELSGDGIDCACDPDPNRPGMGPPIDLLHCWEDSPGSTTLDCDGDNFNNRGDNCPLVANEDQADADADTIGDECDLNPTTADGVAIEVTLEEDVDISGPAPPVPGEDTDGDGFDDATEADLGSCYTDDLDGDDCEAQGFGKDVLAEDSTPEHTSIAGTCTDEEDNDLDGYIDDVDGGCGDDTDGDGASDEGEEDLGSDPEDANSTPEHASVAGSCTDGVDNDGDGDTDAADEGCAEEEVTPTPTVEAETPTVEAETPTPTVDAEYCSPVFPGTYNGLVRIDGQPAASGYEVTASIDGVQWGSALVSGGRYAMDIPDHMPTEPPCFEGGTITFALDAMECTPTADWASGIHTVDLSCAPAAPPVTPTPEVTPTPTITPTTVPPTGAGGLSGSGPGLPLWAMALASWAGLMIVAGLGTLVAVKRR